MEGQPVTWGSQYKFLGNEDDGGLMDFGARFYDPLVGRFTSPDPIKDVSSANVVNPYVYCANNPLAYTDKFGLDKERPKNPGEGGGGHGGGGFNNRFLDDRAGLQFLEDKVTTPWRIVKPVIAQVHGICVAGGNDIAGAGG